MMDMTTGAKDSYGENELLLVVVFEKYITSQQLNLKDFELTLASLRKFKPEILQMLKDDSTYDDLVIRCLNEVMNKIENLTVVKIWDQRKIEFLMHLFYDIVTEICNESVLKRVEDIFEKMTNTFIKIISNYSQYKPLNGSVLPKAFEYLCALKYLKGIILVSDRNFKDVKLLVKEASYLSNLSDLLGLEVFTCVLDLVDLNINNTENLEYFKDCHEKVCNIIQDLIERDPQSQSLSHLNSIQSKLAKIKDNTLN